MASTSSLTPHAAKYWKCKQLKALQKFLKLFDSDQHNNNTRTDCHTSIATGILCWKKCNQEFLSEQLNEDLVFHWTKIIFHENRCRILFISTPISTIELLWACDFVKLFKRIRKWNRHVWPSNNATLHIMLIGIVRVQWTANWSWIRADSFLYAKWRRNKIKKILLALTRLNIT